MYLHYNTLYCPNSPVFKPREILKNIFFCKLGFESYIISIFLHSNISFTLVGNIWHPTKYTPDTVITWVANQPTGWVSESCWLRGFYPTNVSLLSPLEAFQQLQYAVREWHNEMSEVETLVTKCVGDETRWGFSDPIYSNNSVLGKGMMACYLSLVFNISISRWDKRTFGSPQRRRYLICAFIGVSLLPPCLVSVLFISLIISVSLFSLYLCLFFCSACASYPLLFCLSLYFIHWSCLLWTVS